MTDEERKAWDRDVVETIKCLRDLVPEGDNFEERLNKRVVEVKVGLLRSTDAELTALRKRVEEAEGKLCRVSKQLSGELIAMPAAEWRDIIYAARRELWDGSTCPHAAQVERLLAVIEWAADCCGGTYFATELRRRREEAMKVGG